MSKLIENYALIGDTQTAALVARDSSIDWLCLPRFDSGACFAALLGNRDHGRWLVAPADGANRTSRRYVGDSLVLETEMETDAGTVRLVDFMPPRETRPDLVRVVEGVRGRVPMRMSWSSASTTAPSCRGCSAPKGGCGRSRGRTAYACTRPSP